MATARREYTDEDTAINETPGVCGGYPCIGKTRIPVRVLVEAFHAYGSAEAVADYFPQLTRDQVDAALATTATIPPVLMRTLKRIPMPLQNSSPALASGGAWSHHLHR